MGSRQRDVLNALRRRLAVIEARLARSAHPDAAEHGVDSVDDSVAQEQREESLHNRARLTDESRRIRAAIDQLDADGVVPCLSCRAPITPKRLLAVPGASRCVRCQTTRERIDGQPSRDTIVRDDDDE